MPSPHDVQLATKRAADACEHSEIYRGLFECLREMDDLAGGAGEWDQGPFASVGLMFAVVGTKVDGHPALGLAALPATSAHLRALADAQAREHEGGNVGRAMKHLAMEIKMGQLPADLRQLLAEDGAFPIGIGHAYEAWAVMVDEMPTTNRPLDWASSHPDRVEARYILMVTFDDELLIFRRDRGSEPEQRLELATDTASYSGGQIVGLRVMGRHILSDAPPLFSPN